MKYCDYLIVGGGMAADAAAKAIRSVDAEGSICMYCSENHLPYKRPVLSKKLWQGKPLDIIRLKTDETNADIQTGVSINTIDPAAHTVTDSKGKTIRYKKLLIATGGRPRKLDFGEEEIIYYRTLDDYMHLRELSENLESFAVIGGGFIGSEVAASLSSIGKKTHIIMPDANVCARLFPVDLAQHITSYYKNKGVEVTAGDICTELERDGDSLVLKTREGAAIATQAVIAGIGIIPNVELAQSAGLPVENGIVTAADLTAGHPDIYAAGDCAAFVNPATGVLARVEHEDNAVTMGKTAGLSMAGENVKYEYLPMFYSDMFEMGYEAVGHLDSRLEVIADWTDKYDTGVLYYMDNGRVAGVLLWNVWDKVDEARGLILSKKTYSANDLKGRITP